VTEVTDKQQYYRYFVTSAFLVEEVTDKQQYYRYFVTSALLVEEVTGLSVTSSTNKADVTI
jgi:hypothetical protein